MNLTIQQKKALDLRRNLVVNAGAGSGKTTVLVERYLKILLEYPETHVENVLAITFTEKAAAEMKARVMQAIYDRFESQPDSRPRLFELIKQFSGMQISTIHSFCSGLLKEFALLAGIPQDFSIASGAEMQELIRTAYWELFFDYAPATEDEAELELRALRSVEVGKLLEVFQEIYHRRELVLDLLTKFSRSKPEEILAYWQETENNYFAELLAQLRRNQTLIKGLQQLSEGLAGIPTRTVKNMQAAIERFQECVQKTNLTIAEFVSTIKELAGQFFTSRGELRREIVRQIHQKAPHVQETFTEVAQILQIFIERASLFSTEEGAIAQQKLADISVGLAKLLTRFLEKLELLKRNRGVLDFSDLLIRTLHLLRENEAIVDTLRQRYHWILVDEFQDTDPIQSEILRILMDDSRGNVAPPNLFLVGDPKQSIYGFRQADVRLFLDFARRLQQQETGELEFEVEREQMCEVTETERRGLVNLPDNFRSHPELLKFFNRLFRPIFESDPEMSEYFQELNARRAHPEPASTSTTELHLIECTSEHKQKNYLPVEIQQIVEIIQRVTTDNSYRTLDKESGQWRAVQPGDIAILLRDRGYLSQLEAEFLKAGVPFETQKGQGFFQKQEIQDIYYFMKAIFDLDDDFALLTVLRSPFVGLSDVTLLFVSQCQGDSLFQKLKVFYDFLRKETPAEKTFREDFNAFLESKGIAVEISRAEQLAILQIVESFQNWHILSQRGDFSTLLNEILEKFSIRTILANQQFAPQALANLDKLIHFTYQFEQKHTRRLGDYLGVLYDFIQGEMKEGEAPTAPSETEKVQILTIHSAKGLEFPVVILPFLEKKINLKSDMYIDRQLGFLVKGHLDKTIEDTFIYKILKKSHENRTLAEEKRLLYVAATRARDHLFLIGAQGFSRSNHQQYLNFIKEALALDENNQPQRALPNNVQIKVTALEEVATKLEDIVFDATPHQEAISGSETFEEALRYLPPVGEPQEFRAYSATQLMIFEENPERYFAHYYLRDGELFPPNFQEDYADEPGGALWGSLVHQALKYFHLRTPEEDRLVVEKLLSEQFLDDGVLAEYQENMLRILKNLRESEWGRYLLSAHQRSEVIVQLKLTENCLLKGVFDRLIQTDHGQWEVLDFKTNRIESSQVNQAAEKYRQQMAYYALLLRSVFPDQTNYVTRLLFLHPMEELAFSWNAQDLLAVRERAISLIQQIQQKEKLYFSPF